MRWLDQHSKQIIVRRFQFVYLTLLVLDVCCYILDFHQSFSGRCVRLNLIFSWLANCYTHPWHIAEDVSSDAGRTGPEVPAMAKMHSTFAFPTFPCSTSLVTITQRHSQLLGRGMVLCCSALRFRWAPGSFF